jgi:tRNA(adenine34) deaminase
MTDQEYMREAIKSAQIAAKNDEVPVGAVVVYGGEIIGVGHNQREEKEDISSHAEIEAIRQAEQRLGKWTLEGCTIYVTLEPCLMCAGAISQSRLERVVFGALDAKEGALVSHFNVYADPALTYRPLVQGGVLETECRALLTSFFAVKR